MKFSPDGLVSLSIGELLDLGLVHYFSGLDENVRRRVRDCGRPVLISGYTEWVHGSQPALSLGWDWQIETTPFGTSWVRVGLPRTNLLLVNGQGETPDWNTNLQWLGTVADALPWKELVPYAIEARYGWAPRVLEP